MTIALLALGELLGASCVSPNHGDSFTRRNLALGEDLAARVATAIDDSRLMRQAKRALAARSSSIGVTGVARVWR